VTDPREQALLELAAKRFSRAIRPATPADLGAMARIHATSGTPGLLADLGEGFLRDIYYRGLLASPLGRALVVEAGGRVGGFVSYSVDSARLYRDIFRRRRVATLVAVARASLRRPRVALHFLQTILTVDRKDGGADYPAETVSLEVDPAFQGLGIGFVLFQAAITELRALGATRIKSRILADNRAVERLHPPLGFREKVRFRLHGRDWILLVLDLND
jgi:GNAT superfamily N-acetyltransferase